MSNQTNNPGMVKFVEDMLAWTSTTYPERRVRSFAIIMDDGTELRAPLPASAFAAQGPAPPAAAENKEVDDAILGFLRGRKGERMTAGQIRDGLEKEERIVYGQSTVERALARMRGDGRLTHRQNEGYQLAT